MAKHLIHNISDAAVLRTKTPIILGATVLQKTLQLLFLTQHFHKQKTLHIIFLMQQFHHTHHTFYFRRNNSTETQDT